MGYWDLVPASAPYRRPQRTAAHELLDLGWWGANALAPNIASLAAGEAPPPIPNLPPTPGKVPSTDDPRIAGAMGEAANIGMALMPMPGAAAAGPSRWLLPGLTRRSMPMAEMPIAESLASRSASLYNPPVKPQLPLEAQYPHGAPRDAIGRITHDNKGRKIVAEYIVGRNVVGQPEKALSPAELVAVAEKITGRQPTSVAASEIGGETGRYSKRAADRLPEVEYWRRPARDDGWQRDIYLRDDLTAEQAGPLLAHEVGHGMEDRAGPKTVYKDGVPFGTIPSLGLERELGQVYHDLNDPSWRRGKPARPLLQTTPRDRGYRSAEDIRAEYWAEAFRAAMTDPNYMKTVSPRVYEAIADAVNSHPFLSRIIQFNALAALLGGGVDQAALPVPKQSEPPFSQ